MNRAFWNFFRPAASKYSLEELRELYGTLVRNPVVGEANRATVVETLRRVAEYMIWADQNEPRLFDFFLENNVLTYLRAVLEPPANRGGEVAKQVLQTLSIIIQNVRSETAIFFLFSNHHIDDIVDLDFDFSDEEVLGYYISFLKAISLRLSPATLHFFVDRRPRPAGRGFPLYERAVRLAHHREGMVRAAVRTLTLHVYSIADPGIEAYVVAPPASRHFTDIAVYLAQQVQVRRQQQHCIAQ
jgi:protein CLEC16A